MKYAGCLVFGLAAVIVSGIFFIHVTYTGYEFDISISGRLKRAADASTVDLASTELAAVITYLNDKNFTKGNTSVLFPTPENDIGFFYTNLNEAYHELKKVHSETTQFEKTNILMKLRETLLDHDKVTYPTNLYIYPQVGWYIFSMVVFGVLGIAGIICLIIWVSQYIEEARYY